MLSAITSPNFGGTALPIYLEAFIIETLLSDKQMDFINRSNYSFSLVKNRFLSLEYQHIQYDLECFHKTTKEREIKNVKQYLKTMLFNAPVTIDTHYTAKVNNMVPWRCH